MAYSLKRADPVPIPSDAPVPTDRRLNAIAAIVLALGIVTPFWGGIALVIYLF